MEVHARLLSLMTMLTVNSGVEKATDRQKKEHYLHEGKWQGMKTRYSQLLHWAEGLCNCQTYLT